MNRDHLTGLAIGLAAGLLIAQLAGLFGFQFGRAGGVLREAEPTVAAPAAGGSAPAASPAADSGDVAPDASQQIAAANEVVQRDPRNRQAWVALGNLYFDTHQPQKSIDAYAKALELKPDDPNVLTDQGVMYRSVGAYDKAIANFQKANQLDPGHLQSLYNLGVVYAFDLKNTAKAEEAWNELIRTAPDSDNAKQARQALAQIKGR